MCDHARMGRGFRLYCACLSCLLCLVPVRLGFTVHSHVCCERVVCACGCPVSFFFTACAQAFPLRYTPRRLSVNPDTKRVAIVEADHNAFSLAQKKELKRLAEVRGGVAAVLCRGAFRPFVHDENTFVGCGTGGWSGLWC